MKTALQDPVLIFNLNIDCHVDDFVTLLQELSIKHEVKRFPSKELYSGIKGKDGKPLKMTKERTEVTFPHKIYFIDIPYLSVESHGFQDLKYTRIVTKFNEFGIVQSQVVSMDSLEREGGLTPAYEIIEPLLSSDLWEVIGRKSGSQNFGHRSDLILLQNLKRNLLAFYNEGRAITFNPLEQIELYKKDFIIN